MDCSTSFLFVALSIGFLIGQASCDPVEDKNALLNFISNMPHVRNLNWSPTTQVCNNWVGVICTADESNVMALRLPGIGLTGPIPPNTLSRLSKLQILSLRSNSITGPFPSDFVNLTPLVSLYLQGNNLYGPLPSDFSPWKKLVLLNLAENNLNGTIPSSLSNLTELTGLSLQNNSLSGNIPDLSLPNLRHLNLANNRLNGTIPKSLQGFPNSSFAGNDLVFNSTPLSPVSPPNSSPVLPPSQKSKKFGNSAILAVAVAACALVFVTFATLMVVCLRKKNGDVPTEKNPKGGKKVEKEGKKEEDYHGEKSKLVFFEGSSMEFDLEDLLRASAEVLGKGTFGTAYKAVLEDSTAVVVKRLKEVVVGKRDFEQLMEAVGIIRHENVVPLRAYYYSKDEKLLVYDYFSEGSLAARLHGKKDGEKSPFQWDLRVRIAVGVARGIAHIHAESGGRFVHANIKSSNILIHPRYYGCISDFGLSSPVIPVSPVHTRAVGYRAPEVMEMRKPTQKSDVYSFGVLLLELLTGKSPIHIPGSSNAGGCEIIDLARWAQSVVREEWTAEVFDIELMKCPGIEEELVQMLQIAMACVARVPDQRPKMADVVKMIEDVRQFDSVNPPSSDSRTP
ncbi:putative inactive receptor kinase [Nymphaea thermarum]|nr:putative inactive receptor kinase [Nymphaea thermarum]